MGTICVGCGATKEDCYPREKGEIKFQCCPVCDHSRSLDRLSNEELMTRISNLRGQLKMERTHQPQGFTVEESVFKHVYLSVSFNRIREDRAKKIIQLLTNIDGPPQSYSVFVDSPFEEDEDLNEVFVDGEEDE